jgi:hypothetical protein
VIAAAAAKRANQSAKAGQEEEFQDLLAPPSPQEIHRRLGPTPSQGRRNPFNKPPVPVLKKSGESFLQVSRTTSVHPS